MAVSDAGCAAKWHGTGGIQRLFQHGGFVCNLLWCVLGQAVGRSQRRKGIGIGLHQRFQTSGWMPM